MLELDYAGSTMSYVFCLFVLLIFVAFHER